MRPFTEMKQAADSLYMHARKCLFPPHRLPDAFSSNMHNLVSPAFLCQLSLVLVHEGGMYCYSTTVCNGLKPESSRMRWYWANLALSFNSPTGHNEDSSCRRILRRIDHPANLGCFQSI